MKRHFVMCQTSHHIEYALELKDNSTVAEAMPKDWVQLSEIFTADVVPMHTTYVLAGQLAQIDAAEKVLRGKFQHELDKLADRRSSLLAICHTEV